MKRIELPAEYAIVLHQIDEGGEEDFTNLVETLEIERSRLAHIVESLEHKGLVALHGDGQRGLWLQMSAKGKRLLEYAWPKSSFRLSY